MKNPLPLIFVVGTLAVLSLNANHARADWDAAGEAREAAERKAEQQRAAKKRAEHDKVMREASAKAYREGLGKEAVGKSDAEVERIYKQRQNDALRQAKTAEAAMAAASRNQKKGAANNEFAQGDAAMKAMYGKSMADIANMSEKERDALFMPVEKKSPK